MALTETKIVQVANEPAIINECNRREGLFGWNVLNVQVTHSQDTRTYTKGLSDYYSGDKTVETTTINYATITYQRDKHMPNYAEISSLEREFDALSAKIDGMSVTTRNDGNGVFKYFTSVEKFFTIFFLIFFLPLGLLLLIIFYIKNKASISSTLSHNQPEISRMRTRQEEILDKVADLA